ncbi:hypothetical protein DFJ77DRAFT_178461 [Powellomyces hirtus]|nr:hypothetical protein DFJ77DRAFT_178461 [Powellomyces hirtus]
MLTDAASLPLQFLSRADAALAQLDALLHAAQNVLADLRADTTPLTNSKSTKATGNLGELLESLKPDAVYLDETNVTLDSVLLSEQILDDPERAAIRDTLRAERDRLRKRTETSSQTLHSCLTRCYQLQDLLADLDIGAEYIGEASKTVATKERGVAVVSEPRPDGELMDVS